MNLIHCQCDGIEDCFDTQRVTNEQARFCKRGMATSTRLLDVGAGVGAVIFALLQAGVSVATDVDASAAYLTTARDEAERQGLAERIVFHHGDFVALAPTLPAADTVTLDRVICCYDDMPPLVSLSAARAQKFYGVVYLRNVWWLRLFIRAENMFMQVKRTPMRFFVYPTAAVDATIRAQGLEEHFYQTIGPWQVAVYARM